MAHYMNKPISRRVTVKEIAHIAGVSSSAVSNWKRRYTDFPRASESGSGGEFYDIDEVMSWLKLAGRSVLTDDSKGEMLRLTYELLAKNLTSDESLLVTLQVLYVKCSIARVDDPSIFDGFAEPLLNGTFVQPTPTAVRALWDRVVDRLTVDDPGLRNALQLPDKLEDRALQVVVMSLDMVTFGELDTARTVGDLLLRVSNQGTSNATASVTPDVICTLFRRLLEPIQGTVYDPAAGQGLLLARVVEGAQDPDLRIFGQEVSDSNWRIAYLHLALHGVSFELAQGDTLRGDRFRSLRADRVVLDGPMGVRLNVAEQLSDERWRYGYSNTADWMWVQHVLAHLAPEGVGAVLLPSAALSRSGRDAHIREGIVRDGRLHAVIELPPKMLPGFSLSSHCSSSARRRSGKAMACCS